MVASSTILAVEIQRGNGDCFEINGEEEMKGHSVE